MPNLTKKVINSLKRAVNILLTFILKTNKEVLTEIASRIKSIRLAQNLTQEGLSLRSSVSLGSIKRFEKSGQISLQSLVAIAIVLGKLSDFENLFNAQDKPKSLFIEPPISKPRQRGRIT